MSNYSLFERNWRRAFRPSAGWLFATGLLVGHQLLQRCFGVSLTFIDHYLDPFLSVPVLVGLAAAQRRWLLGEASPSRRMTTWEIIGLTLMIAVVGEELFPRLDPVGQTHDVVDYLAYGLGGLLTAGWVWWRSI